MATIGDAGLDGGTAKTIYEDLSIIHAALGEDWQPKLVELLRWARLPEAGPTLTRWEVDHGYRRPPTARRPRTL